MKKLIMLITIMLFCLKLTAQMQVEIIDVYGEVLWNKKTLTKGEIIEINKDYSELFFKTKGAALKICYNDCSKNMMLFEEIINKTYNTSKISLIDKLGKLIESNQLYTRHYDDEAAVFEHLLKASVLYIVDTLKIEICENEYKLDDDHFLYAKYTINEETVNRLINHYQQTIIIDSSIFKIDGVFQEPDSYPVSIYYYDSINETSELISENFYPIYLNKSDWLTVNNIVKDTSLSIYQKQNLIHEFMLQINNID